MPDNQKNVYLTIESSSEHVVDHYFNSAEEALTSLPLSELGSKHTVYLGFAPTVSFDSLEPVLRSLDRSELVIFLQANPSFSDSERMDIYQKARSLVNSRTGNLHVFLLNRPDNQNLRPFKISSLALRYGTEQGQFTKLRDKQGYYLSSQDLFSTIFSNKQKAYLENINNPQPNNTELNALHRRLQQSENLAELYITAVADPTAVRKLKKATKQQLKERLKYRVSSQIVEQQAQNQQENQALSQQQTVNQAQALNQNLNNKQSWSFSAYDIWNDVDKKLVLAAQQLLANEQATFDNLSSKGYLIPSPDDVRKRIHPTDLYKRILGDYEFRQTILSHIFGEQSYNSDFFILRTTQETITFMEPTAVATIIKYLPYYLDN